MKRLCYDIEADGLAHPELDKKGNPIPTVSLIHCIAVQDVDTGQCWAFPPHLVPEAVDLLNSADILIGHNIIDYDNRVLSRLLPGFQPKGVIDTLIVGRLMYPDRTQLPEGLHGHSLKAWAQFVGDYKMDYDGGWEQYSEEMMEYCQQDVAANVSIFKAQEQWLNDHADLVALEQQVAAICVDMAECGFGFDEPAAEELLLRLSTEKCKITDQLRDIFPDIVEERWSDKTGKRLKDKVTVFNPGSSQQWADRLGDKYRWRPKRTDSDNPIVDEATLKQLDFPEAKLGLRYRDLNKKIGMVSDWLNRSDGSGCVRGRTNSQGTATGRASHSQPNLAQVPSDPECRRLFGPLNRDWVQVGCDLSGIELRCLAHYMHRYDKGAYADVILNGDIHTMNQEAAGLPTRADAKTFIYALIYGAGDAKIGKIVGGNAKDGAGLRANFFQKIPALERLIKDAQFRAKKTGQLRLLDGRVVPVRSDYKALNTLLQGAGAVISKYWLIEARNRLCQTEHNMMAWVHDEIQVMCPTSLGDVIGQSLVDASLAAGQKLRFNMPVDAEYQIGKNWSETH